MTTLTGIQFLTSEKGIVLKSGFLFGVLFALSKLIFAAEGPTIELQTGQRQLFLDDYIVERIDGLQCKLHQPHKRGIVLKPDQSWENGRVSAFSAPIWVPDEQVYKWVYRPGYKDWSGIAVSEDGMEWEKPLLNMVEKQGSKQNNVFSDQRIQKVVYDPHDPDPQRRYKGMANKTPVVSGDLLHWNETGTSDFPGGDSGSLTFDEDGNRFLVPVKLDDPEKESYRQFGLVTGTNFENWNDISHIFAADEEDQRIAIQRIRRWLSNPGRPRPLFVEPPPHSGWTPPKEIRELPKRRESWNAQINNVSVFPYQGQYIAFITLLYPTGAWLPGHENTTAFFMVEIASSRDLKTWNRMREPFLMPATLDHGVVNNYERMLVQPVHRPVIKEDELWIYYNGIKEHMGSRRYENYMDGTPRNAEDLSDLERQDIEAGHSAIYLSTMRLDGFVSLDAGNDEGSILTKPLNIQGGELFLNASIREQGNILIEILDVSDEVIGISESVTGDSVRLPVRWKEGFDPGSQDDHTIRIKIHLKNASLYSFWME